MTTDTFDSGSGTWTVPTGQQCDSIQGWGGGGGGGGGDGSPGEAAGGGGGGGYFSYTPGTPIPAGTNISYSVGSGGIDRAAHDDLDGGNGTASTVSTYSLTANGGNGGKSVSNGSTGGLGGTASGGNVNTTGTSGSANSSTTGGNGGAGANGGAGGTGGGSSSPNATAGTAPGGGGGGGGRHTRSGKGAAGRIIFTYSPAGGDVVPAEYDESIGISSGSGCGTGPSVGAAANIGLSATAATDDGALATLEESIAFDANQGVDNSTLLWVEEQLALICQSQKFSEAFQDVLVGLDLLTGSGFDTEGTRGLFVSLDLPATGGFGSEMKPEFSGLLNLAVSHDCQFSTSMTAVAILGLDAKIEEAYVSQGFLRASLPVLHTVAVDMVGGSVFEISCEVSTKGDLAGTSGMNVPLSVSIALAQLLGVSPQLFGIGSSQIQAGGTVSVSASEVLQASFVLGLANRLQSTASVGLAFTWATSLQAAIETTVKQSSICQSVLSSGLGLESLSLLNGSARITVTGKPQISDLVSVDYRRQFSIVAGAAVWTKGTKVYDSLIVLGIDSIVAGQATAALMDVANLAANAEVQSDSTLKALASIGFVVEQAANVQLLLGVSARGNLALRQALAMEARGDWLRLVSLAQKLTAGVQTTGTIDEGVLIGIEQTLVANVKGMIAGAIATSVSPVIDAQVKVFKEAAATIGLSQEVLTSSVAHFRSAIVAAVTHRLEMVNFDPQVIRIVSELLSRSTVTKEGLKVSRIVDETIVRAE